jgi:hypothetical protein
MLLVWFPINSYFLTCNSQWSIIIFKIFKNWSIEILLILKIFKNLMDNIFINVNMVENTCTIRWNLIPTILCSMGLDNFCSTYKNVMHFFIPNPFASICMCFTLCFSIFVIHLSHLVNFVLTLFGRTFFD